MVTGLEIVVGYLAAYAWRKARRVAGRADDIIDDGLDAGLERLHDKVTAKLGSHDKALTRLETQAGADLNELSVPKTAIERVRLALEDEVDQDPAFGDELQRLIEQIQALEKKTGTQITAPTASGNRVIAIGGDNNGIASSGDNAINIQRR